MLSPSKSLFRKLTAFDVTNKIKIIYPLCSTQIRNATTKGEKKECSKETKQEESCKEAKQEECTVEYGEKEDCGLSKPYINLGCKNVVVFGGTEGIGYLTAHQLLCNKVKTVALLGRDASAGVEAVSNLNCAHGKNKAMFVKCDVTNHKQVDEGLSKVVSELKNLHIVVNTVGIWDGKNWTNEVNTNFTALMKITIASEKYLTKPNGVIVNMSGVHGLQPLPASPTLAGEQAGIIHFLRSIGHEANFRRTGIRILTLCPGVTKTNFIKDAETRALTPEMGNQLTMFFQTAIGQKPDVCASSVVEILKYGPPGSVWAIEGSRLFKLKFPCWNSYATLVSQFS